MKQQAVSRHLVILSSCHLVLLSCLLAGCEDAKPPAKTNQPKEAAKPQPAKPEPAKPAAAVVDLAKDGAWKRTELAPDLWLEVQGKKRRVVVGATVCLRKGDYGLECLLCRNGTKEHESVLTTPVKAEKIHGALIVTGAEPGSPVKFEPRFQSPTGSKVRVQLRYMDQGKTLLVPAQKWVRNAKTKKDLEFDWVFAGSILFPNPEDKDKPPIYAANGEGGFITLTNLPTAMLDLPINSPKSLEDRVYEPHTERIPPLDTKVEILLSPLTDSKD